MDYVRKHPNGKYVKEAQEKIKAWGIDDNRKREETAFWNLCSPNDKSRLQEYLRKYPNGMYVIRAKSLIADLERFEKAAIEESRMYNQCRTRVDYMEYLRQYPNGLYKSQAQSKINEFDKLLPHKKEKPIFRSRRFMMSARQRMIIYIISTFIPMESLLLEPITRLNTLKRLPK